MTTPPLLNFALNTILRFLLITPFNIVLIIIPGLVTFILILATWSVVFFLFAASIATPILAFQTELFYLSIWSIVATISSSLFSFFSSIFLGFIIFVISKHFFLFVVDYIVWNIKYIFKYKKATL